MDKEIRRLQQQIQALRSELEQRIHEQRKNLSRALQEGRSRLSSEMQSLRRYRTGLGSYLRHARPLAVLTAPIIYGMVLPLALLDLTISLYQAICFRIYGIPRVLRGDYIVIDRHRLPYLNAIEKLNCLYCGYGNGLIAYSREIIARTEKHWCPIRHARDIPDPHSQYDDFIDYGDAREYREQLPRVRNRFHD